jgi:hypothetical protein
MKASDKPEISKKWWASEKPSDIKGVELEKALAAAEKALGEVEKNGEPRAIDGALTALSALELAVDKTIKKECDKKKHKELISVLEKYSALIKSKTNELNVLQKKAAETSKKEGEEKEDEEESDDKIFQSDYLYKMLKLLKSTGKELNFGFGLDAKNPGSSKLVLTRKGKPDRLFKALKQTAEFSSRLITYGRAVPDAQDGKTLVFKLAESAGEPPQIQKLGRQFLRADKSLKFRKLKLVLPGGQTLEDNEPDTEDEPMVSAGPSVASSAAGDSKPGPSHDKEVFRKEIERLKQRLDELMAAHHIRA